jgi:hypothetical protein
VHAEAMANTNHLGPVRRAVNVVMKCRIRLGIATQSVG